MQKLGVIDLGSNTFHLLIVEANEDKSFENLYRNRVFVGLSEGGIDTIKDHKIQEGLDSLRDFKKTLDHYKVDKLRVIGTAVLRKASNRHVFLDEAHEILQTDIEIIDGLQEAELIYKGIMLLPGLTEGHHLIMDIGGGSTEFILVQNGLKTWSNSYTLGVGVLHHMFHHSEPISTIEIQRMKEHTISTIGDMLEVLKEVNITYLIGASGSFEVLQSMTNLPESEDQISEIDIQAAEAVYHQLVHADYDQRTKMQGLPTERAKLIVVGFALKKIILDIIQPQKIAISPYALKEGVLSEMI